MSGASVLRRGAPWFIVAGALLVALVITHAAHAVTLVGQVTSVVDGDTIKVTSRGFETTVRLIGIDTPETRRPDTPVQCFGPAASARAKKLLPAGMSVRLVTDESQDTRDRFGRLLAYVYRPGKSGLASVNYALVATGYARAYVFDQERPFRYQAQFLAAERRARALKRGLWGPPCNGNTTKPDPSQAPAPSLTPPPSPPPPSGPSRGGCDPAYPDVCIPPPPPDLNCSEISARNFRVLQPDPHRFDIDGDGVGCEE
jgi:micrococcal nuclease